MNVWIPILVGITLCMWMSEPPTHQPVNALTEPTGAFDCFVGCLASFPAHQKTHNPLHPGGQNNAQTPLFRWAKTTLILHPPRGVCVKQAARGAGEGTRVGGRKGIAGRVGQRRDGREDTAHSALSKLSIGGARPRAEVSVWPVDR